MDAGVVWDRPPAIARSTAAHLIVMLPMRVNKLTRTTDELVERLRMHCDLLEEYHQKACIESDTRYLGEIAGKLRLLVYRSPSNRPLLLDLMSETGLRILAQFNKPGGI